MMREGLTAWDFIPCALFYDGIMKGDREASRQVAEKLRAYPERLRTPMALAYHAWHVGWGGVIGGTAIVELLHYISK